MAALASAHGSYKTGPPPPPPAASGSVLIQPRPPPPISKSSKATNVRCFNCHKVGHLSSDCYLPPQLLCYNCGETGHKAPECTATPVCRVCNRQGHKEKQCALASLGTSNPSFLSAAGAPPPRTASYLPSPGAERPVWSREAHAALPPDAPSSGTGSSTRRHLSVASARQYSTRVSSPGERGAATGAARGGPRRGSGHLRLSPDSGSGPRRRPQPPQQMFGNAPAAAPPRRPHNKQTDQGPPRRGGPALSEAGSLSGGAQHESQLDLAAGASSVCSSRHNMDEPDIERLLCLIAEDVARRGSGRYPDAPQAGATGSVNQGIGGAAGSEEDDESRLVTSPEALLLFHQAEICGAGGGGNAPSVSTARAISYDDRGLFSDGVFRGSSDVLACRARELSSTAHRRPGIDSFHDGTAAADLNAAELGCGPDLSFETDLGGLSARPEPEVAPPPPVTTGPPPAPAWPPALVGGGYGQQHQRLASALPSVGLPSESNITVYLGVPIGRAVAAMPPGSNSPPGAATWLAGSPRTDQFVLGQPLWIAATALGCDYH